MTHAQTETAPFLAHTQEMLETHPGRSTLDAKALLDCIQACLDCAQSCTACADACLGEADPKMLVRCIRLNLDCADLCETVWKILSRQTAFDRSLGEAVLKACALACGVCAEECERHAGHMKHCAVCAEACRRCEVSCQALLAAPRNASS